MLTAFFLNAAIKEASMCSKKFFSVLVLLLVLVSAVSGCGSGGVTQTPVGASGSGSGAGGNAAGTVSLSWKAPTTNTDGTPLTDLGGFKIHYGTASGNYTATVVVGRATNYAFALPAGTYYFAVTTYDTTGLESGFSNEVTKTVL